MIVKQIPMSEKQRIHRNMSHKNHLIRDFLLDFVLLMAIFMQASGDLIRLLAPLKKCAKGRILRLPGISTGIFFDNKTSGICGYCNHYKNAKMPQPEAF